MIICWSKWIVRQNIGATIVLSERPPPPSGYSSLTRGGDCPGLGQYQNPLSLGKRDRGLGERPENFELFEPQIIDLFFQGLDLSPLFIDHSLLFFHSLNKDGDDFIVINRLFSVFGIGGHYLR